MKQREVLFNTDHIKLIKQTRINKTWYEIEINTSNKSATEIVEMLGTVSRLTALPKTRTGWMHKWIMFDGELAHKICTMLILAHG